jgi:hypothetical protein
VRSAYPAVDTRTTARRLSIATTFLATLILVWFVSMFLHEVWHGLAAEALGGDFVWLRILPGIEIWPASDGSLGHRFRGDGVHPRPRLGRKRVARGGGGVMGSAGNLLPAAAALGCLWLFRLRGWPHLLCSPGTHI